QSSIPMPRGMLDDGDVGGIVIL
mgnify:CR=1